MSALSLNVHVDKIQFTLQALKGEEVYDLLDHIDRPTAVRQKVIYYRLIMAFLSFNILWACEIRATQCNHISLTSLFRNNVN